VALRQNTYYDMPHRILLSNGEIRWLQFIGKPIKDHLGTHLRMIGIVRDISEQKSAQRDDQQWHKTTEMIFDSVGDGILGFDTRGELTFANHAAASLLGLKQQELETQSLKSMLYLTDKAASACLDAECPVLNETTNPVNTNNCLKLNCLLFDTLIAGNTFATDKGVLLNKNGQSVNVAMIGSPIYTDGQITGSVVVFRDLALNFCEQEERQLLETVMNVSSQLIILINESTNIMAWNAAAERTLGYSQYDALNMTYLQLLPEQEKANMVAFFAEVKTQTGACLTTTGRHINKQGQELSVLITAQALRSQNGGELRILCCETLNTTKP
jgi:PAS domain S-box-containing protein